MFAISHGARGALAYLKTHPEITDIKMYSDNSSAISIIFDPSPHPSQQSSIDFCNAIHEIFTINPTITFSLVWTPGHGGSTGMTIVDRLAKSGAKSRLTPVHSFASLSHVLSEIREKNPLKNWKEHIEDHPIKEDSLFFQNSQILRPSLKPPKWFKKLNRPITSRLTQFITGHGYTTEYFDRFKIPNRGACDCSTSLTTPYPPVPLTREHAIKACPRFADARESLRRHAPRVSHRKWPTSNLLKADLLEHFVTFLTESSALSRKYSTATGELRPDPKRGAIHTGDPTNTIRTRDHSVLLERSPKQDHRMAGEPHSDHRNRQQHGTRLPDQQPSMVGGSQGRSIQIVTVLVRPAPTISTTPTISATPTLFSHDPTSDQTRAHQGSHQSQLPQPTHSTGTIGTERLIIQPKDPTT
jgi:hypothetical protein